jgi:hypothetical protein
MLHTVSFIYDASTQVWWCTSRNRLPYTATLCMTVMQIQGGSNMTGTNCDLFTHKSSRSYLNHLVYTFHLDRHDRDTKLSTSPRTALFWALASVLEFRRHGAGLKSTGSRRKLHVRVRQCFDFSQELHFGWTSLHVNLKYRVITSLHEVGRIRAAWPPCVLPLFSASPPMWLLRVHCRNCLFTSLPHCAVRGKRRSTRVPALFSRRQHSGCQRSDSAGRFPSSKRRNCHASHFLGYVSDSRPCHRAREVM